MRLKEFILTGSVFIAGPVLQAQTEAVKPAHTQPTTPKAVESTGRITGTVFCDDTRRPARGADVTIHTAMNGGNFVHVQADNDGSFEFNKLPAGRYRITVNLLGYIGYSHPDPDPDAPRMPDGSPAALISNTEMVTVRSAETVTQNLTLLRGAAIAGRVLYSDGTPVIGAFVTLETIATKLHTHAPEPDHEPTIVAINNVRSMYTDDRGSFRIHSIPPGTYRVAVLPQVTGVHSQLLSFEGLAVYYGDTFHRSEAKTIDVSAADEIRGIQMEVPLDNSHRISGNVSYLDGRRPSAGIATLTETSDPAMQYSTYLQTDGTFHFLGVPSGIYNIKITQAFVATPQEGSTTESTDGRYLNDPEGGFAEATSSVIVKDDDMIDLHIVLTKEHVPAKKEDGDTP